MAIARVSFGQSLPPLLHLYEFATDARDSAGTSHGTLIGGASVVDGALQTDGLSGYVQFQEKIIPTSGSFSVALWFKTVSVSSPNGIFELISQGCSGCPGFYLGHEPPNRWRNFHDAYQPIVLDTTFPSLQAWHHVAVTVDRESNVSRLWVNRVAVATLAAAPMTTGGTATRLARQFASNDEFFHGKIDDVRIYGGVLSETAIAYLGSSYPPSVADCNSDGIVDYGQCRDGSLPDYDGNNVPDCCEAGVPCSVGGYPVQWRVEDGGNGHWYRRLSRESQTWDQMRQSAEQIGGTLASALSPAENSFIRSVAFPLNGGGNAAIGGLRPGGSCGTAWQWIDGSSFSYSNWDSGQPDCSGEEIVVIYSSGVWHDYPRGGAIGAWTGAIAEWSADCDQNGIVDYGEILDGTLADADSNGVPDCCDTGVSCDPCPGDLNGSNTVDAEDLAYVLFAWGTDGGKTPEADINDDGTVNANDLSVVLGSWGPCPD
jgi:hypothetical protein